MSVLFDEQVMDHAQAHLEVVFVGLVLKHLNVKIFVKWAWNWKWLVTLRPAEDFNYNIVNHTFACSMH